jgi:hypothetical protein
VTVAEQAIRMYRQYRSMQFSLVRAAFQTPGLLIALSLTCSLAAVAIAVAAPTGSRVANAVAVVLVLIGGGLGLHVWRVAGRRGLAASQRGTLLQALGRVAPLHVRVYAVNRRDALRYARDLRGLLDEAKWPVTGVFKVKGESSVRGVSLAVRNVVAPPGEAIALMNTLRRIGLRATWDHKPELADDRTVEVLVGRLR